MITSVKKLSDNKFMLNDAVIISDFDMDDKGVSFKLDYDESLVTEQEATDIGQTFVTEALTSYLEKN